DVARGGDGGQGDGKGGRRDLGQGGGGTEQQRRGAGGSEQAGGVTRHGDSQEKQIGGRQITTRGRGGQPGVAVRALNPRHVSGFPEYPIRNLRMVGPDARFAGLSTTGVPMSFLRLTIILAALTSVAVPMTSAAQEAVRTNEPVIETGDVDRFYALY